MKKFAVSKNKNILNGYRSFTYNFTLSALKKDLVNKASLYDDAINEFVIIKSGGKGTQGFSTNVAARDIVKKETITTVEEVNDESGGHTITKSRTVDVIAGQDTMTGKSLVEGFNKESPGRFDMFIENIEFESTMAFTKKGGSSLPSQIRFEVHEPYSINGFIEALHVGAVSAGYLNYSQASFLLKVEFVGYPDNEDLPEPERIPDSTRYFSIGFTGVEVDITERGTRYRCTCVPYQDKGFGVSNVLKKPIQMSGKTVKEILEDFMKQLNSQEEQSAKTSKTETSAKSYNEYRIRFEDWDSQRGFIRASNNETEISKSLLIDVWREPAIYKFPDPGTQAKPDNYRGGKDKEVKPNEIISEPNTIKYAPNGAPVVQFNEKANIHDCITAIIRDSQYTRDLIAKLGKEKTLDSDGMINYFLIRMEVENSTKIDLESRRPYQIFTYIVSPYKVHYTRIPNHYTNKLDQTKLKKLAVREYNYIYTGKNLDVLNFRLNFNNLFFEAIPAAMGNNSTPGGRLGPGENNIIKRKPQNVDAEKQDQNAKPTVEESSMLSSIHVGDLPNAGQPSDDPYAVLAKGMHEAIVNSKANMITGTLEILGDPFYLVTGGIGSYNPKPHSKGITTDGQAAHVYGEVLININFRNPIDIDPLTKGGRFRFDSKRVPFSGIYMVNKVKSVFREGIFKQELEIVRLPGQIDNNEAPANPSDMYEVEDDPAENYTPSLGTSQNPSGRISTLNALKMLTRGFPSPGLPGELSNFTNATGGLGGNSANLLQQVKGAVTGGIGKLTAASSVFGNVIPGGVDQLATGIRLSASGLDSLAQQGLGSASTLLSSANTIGSSVESEGTLETLSNFVKEKVQGFSSVFGVPGSGIGEGASISIQDAGFINEKSIADGSVAAVDLESATAQIPSSVVQNFTELGSKALAAAKELGTSAGGLVSDVAGKVKSLTGGLENDPEALAAKFGIDTSQLSGLSTEVKSKVINELSSLQDKLPSDVSLGDASARGLVTSFLSVDKLQNLPATAPFATAPLPEQDLGFLKSIAETGGTSALAKAFGIIDPNRLKNYIPGEDLQSTLESLKPELSNPLSQLKTKLGDLDTNILTSKLTSAGQQLQSLVPNVQSKEGSLLSIQNVVSDHAGQFSDLSKSVVSKFGSVTQDQSPLSKLMIQSIDRGIV